MIDKDVRNLFEKWEYEQLIKLIHDYIWNPEINENIAYMLSFSLFQRGRFSDSLKVITKVKALNIESPRLKEIQLLIDFSQGNTYTLLEDIEKLRINYKYNSEYLCNLECQVHVDIFGNYTKALKIYIESLKNYPNSGILHYYIWMIYYKKWDISDAYSYFIQALEYDFVYAYYWIVKCIKRDSNSCINIRFFRHHFISKNEWSNDFTCLWNIFYELEEYTISLNFYLKSIKNIPNDYCTYNGIANVLFKTWRYDESFKYFLQSLKLRKDDSYANNGIWNIYYKRKDYQSALLYYYKWYTIENENAYLIYKIWMCYYFLWNISLAKDFLEKSKNLNKENYMVKRYLKKIKYISNKKDSHETL